MKKNILITGASAGIGKATALHLAQKGHKVLVAARRLERLQTLATESATVVGEFVVGELDVSSKTSIDAFTLKHQSFLQDLDVLINNAGLALGRDKIQDSNFEDLQTMVTTNVTGLLELTRQLLPQMIKNKKGQIINLGSVAGITAYTGGAVYCASKAAIHMFTEALRHDLAGLPIRVSTVAPGRVESEFSLVRYRGDAEAAKGVYSTLDALQPEDIAETIAWVIERPAHVNVQELVIFPTEQVNVSTVVPLSR